MAQGPRYVIIGFKGEIQKARVIGNCTFLGIDEHGGPMVLILRCVMTFSSLDRIYMSEVL